MSIFSHAKNIAQSVGIDTRKTYQDISAASIRAAIREQGLSQLYQQIQNIVPNLSDQYSRAFDPEELAAYWETKMRGLHAFQVQSTLNAIKKIDKTHLTIGDIGDSSGNHAAYIRALAPEQSIDRIISINLDPIAVQKVRAKGGEAVQCRAEELTTEGITADLFISFETLEHLIDPINFLHDLAKNGSADYFLLSVPYRKVSRFGGEHIRLTDDQIPNELNSEQVHVHEYSPEDWTHLARFAGWRNICSNIYYQYPRRSPLRLTKALWKSVDFEGFLTLLLQRDLKFTDCYAGWPNTKTN